MALARALHQLRAGGEGRLIVAHYNHGLRGAESDGDQAFVEEMGRELGVRVVAGKGRGRDGTKSEESLRELRYQFLARTADECGARYVATAHTADDNVETVLHNVLRGTGLAGLEGIPRARTLTPAATLIRPLLSVTRAAVLEYLAAQGKTYREDSSNVATTYIRNRIRSELLPLLEREYNPHVREALTRLSRIAIAANDWLEQFVEEILGTVMRSIDGGIEIDRHALNNSPDFLAQLAMMAAWRGQHWPLQDMSYEKWDELAAFARSPAPVRGVYERLTFPGNIRAEKQGGVLRLTRPAT